MFFGIEYAIALMQAEATASAESARQAFRRDILAKCPPEMRAGILAGWEKQDADDAKYALDERRHRELCAAIRDSKPSTLYGLML